MGRLVIGLISFYQHALSPYWPGTCRYSPTCSYYAREAIERHGVMRGGWMAVVRLSRCHPWGGHGYDPVPVDPVLLSRSDGELSGSQSERTGVTSA